MGYTGRRPSNAPLSSGDIQNGIIAKEDLDTALQSEVDGKADIATTVSGYGITDVYTKTEVDAKVSGATQINTPTITTPTDGTTNYNFETIVASAYTTSDTYNGVLDYVEWQLATDSDFTTIIETKNDAIDTIWQPTAWTSLTTYYVRVRYGSDGHLSEWSDTVSFTTADTSIATPTITTPTEGAVDLAFTPLIETSAFNIMGVQEAHSATDWQIATDSSFTTVVYEALDDTDLVSHIVGSNLDMDTLHYVRARHKTATYTSEWSSGISFTTTSFVEKLKLVGGEGSDYFYSVAIDSSDNYIAVGYSGSAGAGGRDAYIAKFDSDLNLIDDKLVGGEGSDYFHSVAIDSLGNYIAVGYSSSKVAGDTDAYIAKFDSNLNLINDKLIGGEGSDYFHSVAIDSLGNYIAVGYSNSVGAGLTDAYIAKFDSNLNLIDDKLVGGEGSENFESVAIDSSGNYIAVGYSNSAGAGGEDAYIAKFDSNLNLINDKLIGGSVEDYFYSVAIDSLGNYIAVGYGGSAGAGDTDAYIAKFDSNLNLINDKLIGGSVEEYFYSVAIDSLGNYIAVGFSSSDGANFRDAYIAKFDSSLNLIDDKLVGGSAYERFYSVAVDSLGNYIAVGYSSSMVEGNNDALAVNLLGNLSIAAGTTPTLGLTITEPVFTITSPTYTITSPAYTVTGPAFTKTSPTFTVTSPTLTETSEVL